MKMKLVILATTAALGVFVALPAIAALRGADAESVRAGSAINSDATPPGSVLLAGNDDDNPGKKDDDSNGQDDNEEEDSAAANPAPAGTVAPPANGLFGDGAAPQIKVN